VKGEIVAALIDLSKRRKYAKSLAAAVASHLARGDRAAAGNAFLAYQREMDNALVDFTRVLRQLAEDSDRHRKGHRDLGRALTAEPALRLDYRKGASP